MIDLWANFFFHDHFVIVIVNTRLLSSGRRFSPEINIAPFIFAPKTLTCSSDLQPSPFSDVIYLVSYYVTSRQAVRYCFGLSVFVTTFDCNFVTLFVAMFFDFLLATLPENVAAIVTKLSVDGQWLWDHVIKYAR